jgi:hypothetical protein
VAVVVVVVVVVVCRDVQGRQARRRSDGLRA